MWQIGNAPFLMSLVLILFITTTHYVTAASSSSDVHVKEDSKTCDGDSCKKHAEISSNEDSEDEEEPFFFDDIEDEDASTPVLLRGSHDDYPVYEKLTRPVGIKVNQDLIRNFIRESLHNICIKMVNSKR